MVYFDPKAILSNFVKLLLQEREISGDIRKYKYASLNLLEPDFFLILAHPVYKMWIIQEPNKLELWNKLHFEDRKTESIHHF